ncbi:MAG: AAA family ATPase [Thiohalocapsa sp.]
MAKRGASDAQQRDVIAFLRDPASYGPDFDAVDVIETHASLVFLAGAYAYKLKRAVKYPYLDFSTPALRQAACSAELRLNRRTAPQLYLEVRPIRRSPDGRLAWGRDPDAPPLDTVVVMRRFAQTDLLESVAAHGGLSPALALALTAHIAEFHAKAEPCPDRGGAAVTAALIATNIGILRAAGGAGFAGAPIDRVEAGLQREAARLGALLDQRRDAGKVRRVHGDLHLRNICLVDGKPLLFDCIEFSDDIATIDILYDLAFLLMDLGHRGHKDLANLVLNRYLDLSGEDEGIALLPLFLALRAVIRAHVTATMATRGWGGGDREAGFAEARRYLDDAAAALMPAPARLVAIGGLSGSGKSALAVALAPDLGPPPGARVLRSDVLRKLRFGTDPETPLPPEAYTPEISAAVYRELAQRAAVALKAGYAAVIDAVALRPEERAMFAAVAADARMPFTGLWLEAPAAAMTARIAARSGDASDASAAVLQQQLSCDPGPLGSVTDSWRRLDAAGTPAATLAAARRTLMH